MRDIVVLRQRELARGCRLHQVGDHIEIREDCWGIVQKVTHRGTIYVEVGREDDPQPFPEYEVIHRPPPHDGLFTHEANRARNDAWRGYRNGQQANPADYV